MELRKGLDIARRLQRRRRPLSEPWADSDERDDVDDDDIGLESESDEDDDDDFEGLQELDVLKIVDDAVRAAVKFDEQCNEDGVVPAWRFRFDRLAARLGKSRQV